MKKLIYYRSTTPENPEIGYMDHWDLSDDGSIISGGHCSTCPNPYCKSDRKPWTECYALVDVGEYTFLCDDHYKFGMCLYVNDGGRVPTVNPNPNHDGQHYAIGVFVHKGGRNSENKKWRGSAGCFTHHPDDWDNFINQFKIGERGILVLQNFIKT